MKDEDVGRKSLIVFLWPNPQISLLLKEILFMMLPYTGALLGSAVFVSYSP